MCLLSQPFVPLVSRPPGLPPSGDWRRKGRQMTKCFEYRRASYSQIFVVLFFFFCKCAKQIPTFTTGVSDRGPLRLTGLHPPWTWELGDVSFSMYSLSELFFF